MVKKAKNNKILKAISWLKIKVVKYIHKFKTMK